MRSPISIRGCVRRSVGPSVGRSVGRSVRHARVEIMGNGSNLNKIALGIRKYAIQKTIQRQVRGQFTRTHLLSELCSTCYNTEWSNDKTTLLCPVFAKKTPRFETIYIVPFPRSIHGDTSFFVKFVWFSYVPVTVCLYYVTIDPVPSISRSWIISTDPIFLSLQAFSEKLVDFCIVQDRQ